MRLIDADKLVELFTPYVSEDKKVIYQPRQIKIDDIKNAPTVKAIPIEWIKEYASNKIFNEEMMDCYWHFWEEDVLKMIDVWEKKNECRGTDKLD